MTARDVPDILKRILVRKHEEIAERRQHADELALADLIDARAADGDAPRGFARAIRQRVDAGHAGVIAEIKKASPSKGVLREAFDPAAIAESYAAGGAACLSVLTDADFFQGSEAALEAARGACELPVIRKDFLIDAYQIAEARSIGADCVLLIAAALDDAPMAALHAQALSLGMDVLIEVHDGVELARVLPLVDGATDTTLLGINNRDLRSFQVSLDVTLELLPSIPEGTLVITESGILSSEDVQRMRAADVHAFLVGEAFMRADDPGAALAAMFG